ncbi:MAG: AmmeMemoRadiSam system protein A [Candidatus Woesearchaeota archaeon]
MALNQKEKQYLLQLARKSIEYYLDNGSLLKLDEKEAEKQMARLGIEKTKQSLEKLKEKKGCFVTLTVHSMLRGCIGHIIPVQELYKDVIENAVNAALKDPRFPRMVKKELEDVTIEISVLDIPKQLKYKDSEDLINILSKDKPGVILKKGFHQATFLPQVWDDLPTAEEFLSNLCMKAGLSPIEWKNKIEIETYIVEKFKEHSRKNFIN